MIRVSASASVRTPCWTAERISRTACAGLPAPAAFALGRRLAGIFFEPGPAHRRPGAGADRRRASGWERSGQGLHLLRNSATGRLAETARA